MASDSPILNNPYEEPLYHYDTDLNGNLDYNYNGSQFIIRCIYFCGGSKKEFADWRNGLSRVAPKRIKKNAERTLKLVFNDELWDTLYGFCSEPLKYEKDRKVAVRVVSQFGEESSKVLTM